MSASGPPAPRLAGIRSRWLSAVAAALHADPQVVGAGLIGSLGEGRADDWSDIDLLVLVDDAHLDVSAQASTNSRRPRAPRRVEQGRVHTGPDGGRAGHGRGLPLRPATRRSPRRRGHRGLRRRRQTRPEPRAWAPPI
ncbi:nucleotidyltransferase domain-containing protein [Nonomuraea sp. MG754425]|uniref:nucleotidyltransferase domain-containing protein n=1 Tax=Nonomuraea sp. MG754425 TaxID=2570319 RepID=UPI0034D708A7